MELITRAPNSQTLFDNLREAGFGGVIILHRMPYCDETFSVTLRTQENHRVVSW